MKAGYGEIKSRNLTFAGGERGVFRDARGARCPVANGGLLETSRRRIVAVDPGQLKPVQACSIRFDEIAGADDWVSDLLGREEHVRQELTRCEKEHAVANKIREARRDEGAGGRGVDEDDQDAKRRRKREDRFVEDVDRRAAWSRREGSSATMWHLTQREYQRRAGVLDAYRHERWRRCRKSYATAIAALGETTRRTCDPDALHEYARAQATYFITLARELGRVQRRKSRWMTKRRTAKTQDRLAWRLLGLPGRGFRARQNKLAKEGKDTQWDRSAWENAKPIVFFGDGSWAPRCGCAPMPRKALIKRVATRGVVVVEDEFRTSKACPCVRCSGEMEDVPGNHRVRSCKNSADGDGSGCVAHRIDRDVGGVLGILQCGIATLQNRERPPKYCSSSQTSSE